MATVKLSLYKRIIAGKTYYIDLLSSDRYAITIFSAKSANGIHVVKEFASEADALDFFYKMN